MKIGMSISVEHDKVAEIEKNVRAWGWKDRSEFFSAAYEREKSEREKPVKKTGRAS